MDRAISVTQISTYFKQIFEAEELLENISVFGEVSGFSLSRGIAYFSLKDENAILSCVSFSGDDLISVRNGDMVVVTGTPRYYVKGGKLNFTVNKVMPYGVGNLFAQFLALKANLEAEGLFDASHKKEVEPKKIQRIGVISSETGAVIQDIINVTRRRNPKTDIVLYPVKVQGYGADIEIAKAIKFMSDYNVDVVIVARGGGSLEDLQAFNSEIVARAAYACAKPLVSAVGHETDFTIIDFVSDLRAPTPSAAAELVTENVVAKKSGLIDKKRRLLRIMDEMSYRAGTRLGMQKSRLLNLLSSFINEREYVLALKREKLNKVNPDHIMKLGYAKVMVEGKPVVSSKTTKTGDKLEIEFYDGKISAVRSEV